MTEPSEITPARMASYFDFPYLRAQYTRSGLSSAALWEWDLEQPTEISAQPDHRHHVFCFINRTFSHETFSDGKLILRGRAAVGSCQLHLVGSTPRAVLEGTFGNLQVYLADDFVQRTAAEAGLTGRSVDLVDPALAKDLDLTRISENLIGAMTSSAPIARLEFDHSMLGLTLRMLSRYSSISEDITRKGRPIKGCLAPWQIRRATEYLREHLDEEVSLTFLAGLVDLSQFHFARAFKQSVGVPPHAYHSRLRLNEARRLLKETDQSITEIALSVGYEAPQTLARVFRRELGTTPSTFRRERKT